MNPGKQAHLVNSGVYIGALIGGKLGSLVNSDVLLLVSN
ncbi:putative protein P6 [Prunus mahaleb associated luteovirus]|nr:putative protein P6 [Prunus mahaleb associated luteovirus]